MVREIMKDVFFLAQKSDPATKADLQVARDILDTLKAHTDECVGMAANIREGKVREEWTIRNRRGLPFSDRNTEDKEVP